MKDKDTPIVDLPTLRRDLYFVMSLLLADKEMAEAENVAVWAKAFHETEVRRLMLWVATAMRGLLDLLNKGNDDISKRDCGEYWDDVSADFPSGKEPLAFRQACNSVIHAKEMLLYRVPERESDKMERRVYSDRVTIRAIHRGKTTRAQLDIIKFVQIADGLMNFFHTSNNGNR